MRWTPPGASGWKTHTWELSYEKKEMPLLKQAGLQVIDLPPAEKAKFIKIAYEEGWKDIIEKNPKSGPELKALLTRKSGK
jgi:hypothetical protein